MKLIATDLDGTLVGNDAATQDFFRILQPLRDQGELRIVYVSGRSYERIRQQQPEEHLPEPDAIIASVGSEIYINGSLVDEWKNMFNAGWDRDAIAAITTNATSLTLQVESEQRPYKISFESAASDEAEVVRLKSILGAQFPYVEVLSSHAGQYVDIMPRGSDKGSALLYLAKMWSIDSDDIYAAGDSSNDIAMLEKAKAIIVGNAYDELRNWFKEHPSLPAYFAENVFAAGIIEGLRHYGVIS